MKSLYVIILLLCAFMGHAQTKHTVHFEFNQHGLSDRARLNMDSFLLAQQDDLPEYYISLWLV